MGILKKESADVRAFVRLLRELGIFQIWLNNRISYLKELGYSQTKLKRNIFRCVGTSKSFRRIIDESFGWSYTDCEQLWIDLYDFYETYNTPLQILTDRNDLNLLIRIKDKVKNYLKEY